MQVSNSLNSYSVVSGYRASSNRLMPRTSVLQNSQCDAFVVNFKGANPAKVRKCPFNFDFKTLAEMWTHHGANKKIKGVNGKVAISVPTEIGGEMTFHYRKNGTLSHVFETDRTGARVTDYEVKADGRTPDTIWKYHSRGGTKAVFSFSRGDISVTLDNTINPASKSLLRSDNTGPRKTTFHYGQDGKWRVYGTNQVYKQFPSRLFPLRQLSLLQQ